MPHNVEFLKFLDVDDIQEISDKIKARQERFPNEDFLMSVGVVLMNYGEKHVVVRCVTGGWTGTKGDLQPRDGVPLCPDGHPLFEITEAPRLALVVGV